MFGLFELADRHVRGWYDVGLGALFLVPYFVVTSRMNDDEDEDSQAVRPDRRMWVQVVGFILVTTAVGIFAIWDGASSSPANVVYIVIGVAILVGVLVVVSATVNKQWRIRH
jgi:uncharacterized membrane protein YuzA (DUF378 family)